MTFEEFLMIYDQYNNSFFDEFIKDSELISSNIEKNKIRDKDVKYYIYNGLVNSNISSKNINQDLQLIKKYYSDDLKNIYFTKNLSENEISRIIKILDYFICKRLEEIIVLFVAKYKIFDLNNISHDLNIKIEDIDFEYHFIFNLKEIIASNINYYKKYYPTIFNYMNYPSINKYADILNYIIQMINMKMIETDETFCDAKFSYHRRIIIPRNLQCNFFCKYGNTKLLEFYFSTRSMEKYEIEHCFYISSYYDQNDVFIFLKNYFYNFFPEKDRLIFLMKICYDIFLKRNNVFIINYFNNDDFLKQVSLL